jgi:type II secretory pathway pseudopilin PulG
MGNGFAAGYAPAHGYAMVALLVAMSVMAVMLGLALPVWQTAIRREREAELVFRGEQYVQAIRLFQRRYAGTFPPNVDVLVQQRFLRRRYQDPITGSDFQPVYAATGTTIVDARSVGTLGPTTLSSRGGLVGVVSTSRETSLRLYNGRGRYNEWSFVVTGAATTTKSGVIATREEGRPRLRRAAASRP